MATNVSTVNHSGEDYASISLWESATDNNLVSSTTIEVLEVYADDGPITQGSMTIGGATTNASYYRVIRAHSGDEWGGDVNATGDAVIRPNSSSALNVNEDYFRCEDIHFNATASSSLYAFDIAGDDFLLARCLFDQGSGLYTNPGTTGALITRCVFHSCVDTIDIGGNSTVSNCTLYNNTYGLWCAGTCNAYNVVSTNNSSHNYNLAGGSWGSSATCISGNTTVPSGLTSRTATASTSPGTGDWVMYTNLTGGSEDFHLQDHAENDAVGYGTTRGSEEDVDASGVSANTSWDVGAFNLASSATTYTKTTSADGQLETQDITKTTSANGLLESQDITTTTSADGQLETQDITATTSADGQLESQDLTLSTDGDGYLTAGGLLSASADALLQLLDQLLTASANGQLESQDITTTTSADGQLAATTALTSIANGLLESNDLTLTTSGEGWLGSVGELTTSADGVLNRFDINIATGADAFLYDPSSAIGAYTLRSALNTSTGLQSLTTGKCGGDTPKAVMQITTYATANASSASHAQMSVGFTDGTTDVCVAYSSEHGQATTDTTRGMTSNFMRMDIPGNFPPDVEVDTNALIADGVQIDITVAPSAAYLMHLVFFVGSAINAKVGVITTDQPDVEQDVNTVGFEPDVVFFIDADRAIDNEVSDNQGSLGVAVNAAAVEQRSLNWSDEEGLGATVIQGEFLTDYAVGKTGGYRIEVGNFDSSGFSIWPRLAGPRDVGYLALDLGNKKVDLRTLQTSPTATAQSVTLDLEPAFIFMAMSMNASTNTTSSNGEGMPVAVYINDDSDAYTTWMRSRHSADPTVCGSWSSADLRLQDNTGSPTFTSTGVTFGADGVTFNWSAVSGTPRYWWLFSFGDDVTNSITLGASANATLSMTHSPSTTADAVLISESHTIASAADAILYSSNTATTSANAELVAGTVRSASANALLQQTPTLTCGADGHTTIDPGLVKTYAEGWLFGTQTKTVSADGNIQLGKRVTANAILKKTDRTVNCSGDGFILKAAGLWDTTPPPERPDWQVIDD